MIYHGQLLQDKWLDDHFRRRGITHGTFVDIGAFDGDTDGHDLQILRAWPWGRFKPLAIVVEYNKDRVELIEHMESAGYAVADDNGQDLFFTQPEHQ